MAADSAENPQGLRKILDMTRLISVSILIFHFYYYGHRVFSTIGWTMWPLDSFIRQLYRTGLFHSFHTSKWIALGLLIISLMGARGRKDENASFRATSLILAFGGVLYLGSYFIFFTFLSHLKMLMSYIIITSAGYLLLMAGGSRLSRIILERLSQDVFNTFNETFPQEERLLQNEYSINLPARYRLGKRLRNSWINIINPFRGILVIGTPGAGKSFFVIRHIITQHIQKGFCMFCYDFKYPDLSTIVYNTWLNNRNMYAQNSACYFINFDDLSRSHRCNPLNPGAMQDITDATESARTILLGLNREWTKKQGDFFVESAMNFVTAIIWFLRRYRGGSLCTLPHVIELMQVEYAKLFSILRCQPEIEALVNPFVKAYISGVFPQLEGQIASAKIAMARLSSPQLYYVLSGNDFSLDINDPLAPKLLCVGNNPQKIQVYGAVLSLYVNRLIKLVNQKGKLKSSLIFDEFPTIYLHGMDSLLATARSNKVATSLGLQDFSQLRKDYGREQADVISGIVGNVLSGQVSGDTAKQLSERIGKIMQNRQGLSINRNDISISKSKQLEMAVPPSKIASLSSGEFVGSVTDNPDQEISLKAFHCRIQNDIKKLAAEEKNYKPIPVIRKITPQTAQEVFLAIRSEINQMVDEQLSVMMDDPELEGLILN